MADSFVSIDFRETDPDAAYNILVSTIHPRPIAFVSTISADGRQNLAPFSFFMVGGSNPPSLVYSPTLSKYGPKDSLRNVVETGEFVVNSVHREMAEAMNLTSQRFDSEVSEWDVCGLTAIPSLKVRPPRIAESLVQFECRLFKVVEHGDGPGASRYIIGEVVMAHLSPKVWNGEAVIEEELRHIARMGGPNYLDTAALETFQMKRPGG